jgi:chromosomal replication initiator protein
MDAVQIIPFSGRPLEFEYGETSVRFPASGHGFLLGQENGILEPLIQEIIDETIAHDRQPVLLYGVPGIGRTHLLKGILETWRKNQPNETVRRRAYYTTGADFYRQFTESITMHTTDEFRRRYQRAKLLLLDDLEQLLGKSAAQTELRLLLDDFEGTMVITAQTLPDNMKTGKAESLSAELAARIQAGTTIPILLPGEAVRQRFLHDLTSALRIPFTEPLLIAAAKELTGTIPQLYAAVAQKYVEAKAANEPLNFDFWKQFSRRRQPHNRTDLPDIAKQTAAYFSLKLSDIKGESRSKTVALARSLAVYLARSQLRLTFKEIGHFFGKRDPSTVRHLFDSVERTMLTDTALRDHLCRLENALTKTSRKQP